MRKTYKDALIGAAVVGSLAAQWMISHNLGKLKEATDRHTEVVCAQVKAQKLTVNTCETN